MIILARSPCRRFPPGARPKAPNNSPVTLLFAAIGHSVLPACVLLSWVKSSTQKARTVPCLFVIGRRLLPCPQAKRQHGLRAAADRSDCKFCSPCVCSSIVGEDNQEKGTSSAVSFCNREKAAAVPAGTTPARAPCVFIFGSFAFCVLRSRRCRAVCRARNIPRVHRQGDLHAKDRACRFRR